ncbi:hypothetical protein ABN034_03935 [Actinopolymorpha sp. B11F2]|uniref:hypothetical protein n=1 Tax=Actinopolymorpha sp. B11F2 TaxID=3160862 RepID=UPI0032E3E6CD
MTSEGISICWFIERNVAWSQISAITLERELGERFITLHVSGKRRPLPAPRTISRIGVREVEDAYHLVTQTWLKLRGPEWQPPAAPQWNPWGTPPPTDEAHG